MTDKSVDSFGTFLDALEVETINGARADGNVDKSDWVRFWVMARRAQGMPYDSDDWNEAFNGE